MTQRFTPLVPEDLAAQDTDLRPYMYSVMQSTSGNLITDFSPHAPHVAIAECCDFAIRELRYWMNKIPEAVEIKHLMTAGVQRRLGSKAIAPLTFTLSAPLSTPFVLSKGYSVTTGDRLEFVTTELLTIPAGSVNGTVSAEAIAEGIDYNVAAGSIVQLSQSRAYLKSVTNLERASGGLGEETIEEVRARGFAALRYRGTLITDDDYVQEITRLLGSGSVARAIGGLAADKQSVERGAVHVFVLNPDGNPPNSAQIAALQSELQSQVPAFLKERKTTAIATALHISPISILPVKITAIAALVAGDNPITRAREIETQVRNYLKPGNLALGKTVILKELENVVRQAGVEYIQSVSFKSDLGVSYQDLALPNDWTAVKLDTIDITLVNLDSEAEYVYTF